MVLFNKLVADVWVINGTVIDLTDMAQELGTAMDVVLEAEVDQVTGAPATVTVTALFSNSGRGYAANGSPNVTITSPASSLPARSIGSIPGPNTRFVGLRLTCNGSSTAAHVKVWACGRGR